MQDQRDSRRRFVALNYGEHYKHLLQFPIRGIRASPGSNSKSQGRVL